MRWRVPLTGEDFDLRPLVKAFAWDEYRVVHDDRLGYLLEGERFERLADDGEVFQEAARLAEFMNAGMRLAYGARQPIRVHSPYEVMPNGKLISSATLNMTISLDVRMDAVAVRVVDGVEVEVSEPHPLAQWLPLAESDPAVAAALRLYGTGESLSWAGMYSILDDVIKKDAEGYSRIADICGVSLTAIAKLKETAGSFHALGVEARHANLDWAPPKNPMDIAEARLLVAILLRTWLDTKTGRPQVSPQGAA